LRAIIAIGLVLGVPAHDLPRFRVARSITTPSCAFSVVDGMESFNSSLHGSGISSPASMRCDEVAPAKTDAVNL